MKLHSLRLENYRRFRAAEVEFPDGVVAVVGRNGAGKSTLVEAVAWALFGNAAARTGNDLLKRQGAAPAEDCAVVLRFEHAGHDYVVDRRLAGAQGKHVASVTVDGVVQVAPGAHSQKETTAFLERALHLDEGTFHASLVARQRELALLTDVLKPAERKAALLRMLRVDVVDEAVRLCRQAKRDAAREAELLAQGPDPKELEGRALDAESRAHEARRRGEGAAAAAEAHARRAADLRRAVEEAAALAERHQALHGGAVALRERESAARREAEARAAEAARLEAAARRLAEEEARAPDPAPLRARVAALAEARLRAEARARLERDAAEARARVGAAEGLLPELDRAVAVGRARQARAEAVREEAEAARKALLEAQTRAAERAEGAKRAKEDLARLRERLDGLARLGAEAPCPTCERPLEDCHDDLLARLGDEARAVEAETRALDAGRAEDRRAALAAQARLDALAAEEGSLALDVRQGVQAEARREELARTLAQERSRAEGLEAQLAAAPPPSWSAEEQRAAEAAVVAAERAQTALAQLRAEAARLPAAREAAAQSAAAHATAQAARAEAEAALAALAFDPARAAGLRRDLDAAVKAESHERVAAERAAGALAQAEAEAARWREERAAVEARLARRAALLREAGLLERLAGDRDTGLLCDFKVHLAGRIRPMLAAEASALFAEMTEGRYDELLLDDDYGLRVVDDGEPFPLARMSGGESDLANLCLRLAIGRVLAERAGGGELGFLVLDEVFGSQDEQRKASILRALGALAGRFRQILLITHVDAVKEAVDAVLRVEDGPDGTSVVRLEAA